MSATRNDDESSPSSVSPYKVGRTLNVQLGQAGPVTSATISRIFESNLSCTMAVKIDSSSLNGQSVLKLYDRRFASRMRQHGKATAWNPDVEHQYRQFVQSGNGPSFFKFIRETDDEDLRYDYLDDWNDAQREAYLQHFCIHFYRTETEVYRRLHLVQGIDIPRLFASLWIPAISSESAAAGKEFLSCPGLLVEFLHGFPLSDIADFADRET
ncbi:hypothetical protein AJ79_08496 [Helicocarpus griseus UAMH5409]|uniref:Uncharacterized protein n=1 Tax=Helicocarpus griseus UAMH5409 TaxID=1447875 RepID=A0A2B7WSJ6_9EURO|nr:hypothetical protein AJ79_08496 [Helicocarpus griseus UAMH5409]